MKLLTNDSAAYSAILSCLVGLVGRRSSVCVVSGVLDQRRVGGHAVGAAMAGSCLHDKASRAHQVGALDVLAGIHNHERILLDLLKLLFLGSCKLTARFG